MNTNQNMPGAIGEQPRSLIDPSMLGQLGQTHPLNALLQAHQAIGALLNLNLPDYMGKSLQGLVKGLQTMHQTMQPMLQQMGAGAQGAAIGGVLGKAVVGSTGVNRGMLQQMLQRGLIGPQGNNGPVQGMPQFSTPQNPQQPMIGPPLPQSMMGQPMPQVNTPMQSIGGVGPSQYASQAQRGLQQGQPMYGGQQ